ncbi:succinate dehydrogenase [Bacillus salitolerans]|uniref:Succinate dehydrogenase n=1 Tax=Bacillus salitolerans TaxID=1437434 RepID=A0ABW4LUE1_9BACI
MRPSKSDFTFQKIHSLLGVIPVGGYLFVHFLINYQATRGEDSFNQTVKIVESFPFLLFLEATLIYLPILYHAIYGLYIAFKSKHNIKNYSYFRNQMFFAQRITGIITFIFIVWHVWETRVQYALGHVELDYKMMANIFENPFMVVFYLVGTISAIFHFSNGLWSFFVHWGITISPKSQNLMTWISLFIFFMMTYMAIRTMVAFI